MSRKKATMAPDTDAAIAEAHRQDAECEAAIAEAAEGEQSPAAEETPEGDAGKIVDLLAEPEIVVTFTPAPLSAMLWKMILEQHEVVKRASRELDLIKIEARSCRTELDSAQMRLSNLIDKARSGQTDLFDGEAPQGEGVDEPAKAEAPDGQADLFEHSEGEDDAEGEESPI